MTYKNSTTPGALLIHEGKSPTPELKPLTVTVQKACQLSGFGPTTIWKFIGDGRLEIVRVAGIKRTLIVYDSLARLLELRERLEEPPRKRGPFRKRQVAASPPLESLEQRK